MKIIATVVLCTFLLLFVLTCKQKDVTTTVAVIPKGTALVFWQSVHAGAVKAARETNIAINWIGPEKEDDRQQQIAIINNQVINRVDGIVLAPLDAMALRRPVEEAVDNKIPVVIIDSDLENSEDIYTSFIATDNLKGGKIAGEQMVKLLQGKGNVAVLRYSEGSASTAHREEGFLSVMRAQPNITIVSEEQYAGVTKAQAQQASENLLLRFQDEQGNLKLNGVFCPNESTTYGMLKALRRTRLTQQIVFIGFDASEPLIEGVKNEEIDGLVVQNPFNMGYLGVKVLIDHLQGRPVAKRIDTGVAFVTRDRLTDPQIEELINPDLDKWLK
jgi:ribose transport system substrate-binding protein